MQSFRPLQRHTVSQCGTRALVHSRVARIWPGQKQGQINWLETLRYKHLFRTRFRVSCLHSHCYIWTMSFTLTLCPGWPGPPPVLTCHYVAELRVDTGQYPGAGTLTGDQAWWPPLTPPWVGAGGRSGGPARGLLLSNEVLLQLILPSLGRSQLSAPAMTDHFYQLFFNPITSPILFTVSMFNNCLEWHLECSNKTGWN